MRHVAPLLTAFILVAPAAALAAATFSGDLSVGYAARIDDGQTSDRGLRLLAKYTHNGEGFDLRAEGRLRWNEAYADVSRFGEAARDAYRYSADWRELYIATKFGDWHVNTGWQQAVWGKADNLRILDQVNPLDFRDFVLPDLSDYRRSVFMVRSMRQFNEWEVETLFLPWFVKNRNAERGSEYDMPMASASLADGFELLPEAFPGGKLRNGELGVHVARSFGSTDISLVAFYTRDDDPVFRVLPATVGTISKLRPEFHRQWLIGAALAHALESGFVLRGEVGWLPKVTYNTFDRQDGLERSSTLRALLGLDYAWRDWMFTVQATDRYITDWRSAYWLAEHQPVYTLSATGSSWSALLESRLALTAMPHGNGQWLQIKNTYKPNDSWAISLDIDLFNGRQTGYFGQFHDRDRLRVEVKYQF